MIAHRPSVVSDCDLSRLVSRLRTAAELEHQYMCQYLYAAFSLKRRIVAGQPDDPTCSPAQLEMVRRWLSSLYMIARQEMEHLALVNNLLRGLGAPPFFARANIREPVAPLADLRLGAASSETAAEPLGQTADLRAAVPSAAVRSCDALQPIPQRYALSPFTLATAERFTCMESPDCRTLVSNDPQAFPDWCFGPGDDADLPPLAQTSAAGSVEALYDEIRRLVLALPAEAFVGTGDQQVDIIQQYDVYVLPVTDRASALQAVNLITNQGEGNLVSSGYRSHYRRYYDIREEYLAELLACGGGTGADAVRGADPFTLDFQPAVPLREDPHPEDIANSYTRAVFELFDFAYGTLLTMLTGLYATPNQSPTSCPYFAPALGQESFAPFMTMIVRSLAEVLVQLEAGEPGQGLRVGPGYYIDQDLQADLRDPLQAPGGALKPRFGEIDQVLARTRAFDQGLGSLLDEGGPPPVIEPALAPWVGERLAYLRDSARRITVNLRRIYQQGIYANFQAPGY